MKKSWFKKIGWIYAPVSWPGWAVFIAFTAFCANIFIYIDRDSHSVSDTLYGVFPYVIPAFLIYLWIASEKT